MSEEEKGEELTPEAIQELKEKAQKAEELEASLKEKEEELEKLSKKDFNFRKFEKAKKEEREKLLEDMDEKEKMLVEEMSALKESFTSSEQARMDEAKSLYLDSIGADDDLKKKIEDSVKHSIPFLGQPKTPGELKERYARAYGLLRESSGKTNPINQFAPVTGSHDSPSENKKRYTDSQEGKANLKQWWPKVDWDKKK
jgi:hypothetical protein